MTRFRILPYKQGSRSAKALADALDGKVLRLQGSTYTWRQGDVLINWGAVDAFSSTLSSIRPTLNPSAAIKNGSNKLTFFNKMASEGLADILPPFWTSKEDIPSEAFPVVCRTVLSGHSGAGIVIARDASELVEASLYTGYVKKKDEYRVHLGRNSEGICTISVQRKALRNGTENPNWQVRNHVNGFVFVRDGVNPPSCVLDAARQVFESSGLDFGAVDVIYNDKKGKAYVLEINTAPGLEGQTVTDYASFFQSLT